MSSSDLLFANIFSHSVGCLWWFPSLQKLFSLMRSHLLIFASVALAWGDRSKKYCKDWCQGAYYCLCFLKFTRVHGMGKCSSFVLLHVAIQLSQHHLLKELSLPLCIFCLLHCRLIDLMCMDLFLGSLFCSIDLCVWFVLVLCYFDYYNFCGIVFSGECVISSVLSHHSKNLKQGTSVTARLQLSFIWQAKENTSLRWEDGPTQKKRVSIFAPFLIFFLFPLNLPCVNWASQEGSLFHLRFSLWSLDLPLFYFCRLFPFFVF